MVGKPSSKVRADFKKNHLSVVLTGMVVKKELESLYTEIRFNVADLKPGFTVTSDLTQCSLGYLSGLATFTKIREFLESKQVGIVVRITRQRGLVFEQLSRLADLKTGYEVVRVSSMEEAERLLAEREQSVA